MPTESKKDSVGFLVDCFQITPPLLKEADSGGRKELTKNKARRKIQWKMDCFFNHCQKSIQTTQQNGIVVLLNNPAISAMTLLWLFSRVVLSF